MNVLVPLDVPEEARSRYEANYREMTCDRGRLMLFAGDQKIEHLNDDFFGEGIAVDDGDPEHLFRIASSGKIGVFATQMGLIARYGMDYPDVPYLVKLNSKTNLLKSAQADPFSNQLTGVDQVLELRANSGLRVMGVGYTVYLGSEYEDEMLFQAAQVIYDAHKNGLVAVLWVYPRGQAVTDERDPHLIAGATGVAACLGADFVKVNYPRRESMSSALALREAVRAAGRTGVVCAGGSAKDPERFLQDLHDQIHISGAVGNATGRNIHQKPLDEAVRMCDAIFAVTVDDAGVAEALAMYRGEQSD
jgi:fructose-bisphosphate aldolase/6-deoxy-5-ketofructose 1-phosphate synthase